MAPSIAPRTARFVRALALAAAVGTVAWFAVRVGADWATWQAMLSLDPSGAELYQIQAMFAALVAGSAVVLGYVLIVALHRWEGVQPNSLLIALRASRLAGATLVITVLAGALIGTLAMGVLNP